MWYVVWTETGTEAELKNKIENEIPKELYRECRIPTKTEQQKWNGEIKEVTKHLFPGYIFVDTDDPEGMHIKIRRIKYNSRVMKTGDDFTPISEAEQEIIDALTGEDGNVGISTGVLENGTLKVINGPLKGFEKYIVRIDRYKRKAWLKMCLFGEERRFNVSLSVIEKR